MKHQMAAGAQELVSNPRPIQALHQDSPASAAALMGAPLALRITTAVSNKFFALPKPQDLRTPNHRQANL
jgi:hypothetical protein